MQKIIPNAAKRLIQMGGTVVVFDSTKRSYVALYQSNGGLERIERLLSFPNRYTFYAYGVNLNGDTAELIYTPDSLFDSSV